MVNTDSLSKCCGCSACEQVCPTHCITMQHNHEGFLYPYIDTKKCIDCKKCEKVCPFITFNITNFSDPVAYGVVASNKKIMYNSSSGGMFSILAEHIINNNGCIYGVAFSEDFKEVNHIRVETVDQLYKLRGSKYIQSNIGSVYINVKKDLNSGKLVLFSGTPCQILGLHNYLDKEYENLILVDLICHGIPSNALWKKYAEDLEKKFNSKIESVNFRYKNCLREIEDNKTKKKKYYKPLNQDPYLNLFLQDICLRESCYDCKPKLDKSSSDITLADLWGVETIAPDLKNTAGVSLVLLHNIKAKKLFDSVKSEIIGHEIDFKKAISKNTQYSHSAIRPINRDSFYLDMNNMPWGKLVDTYLQIDMYSKIKRVISKTPFGTFKRFLSGRNDRKKEKQSVSYEYGLLVTFNDDSH